MTIPTFWLQPAATFGGAALVLVSAGITLRQRRFADRKQQWWVSTQWALDLVLNRSDANARELGFLVLDEQAFSALADDEDQRLLRTASGWELARTLDPSHTWRRRREALMTARMHATAVTGERTEADERAAQAAAKLWLTTTEKLGLPSDPRIAALAAKRRNGDLAAG